MPFDYNAIVPNFSPMMLLHGEQYLEIRQWPLPTSGRLVSRGRLLEVVDKGSAAIAKNGITTVNAETGQEVFYNEMTVFLRGCGGFDGPKKGQDRGSATAANVPPKRAPDVVVESQTTDDQAAIYRLSGDYKYAPPDELPLRLNSSLSQTDADCLVFAAPCTSTLPLPRWAASRPLSCTASAPLASPARPSTTARLPFSLPPSLFHVFARLANK